MAMYGAVPVEGAIESWVQVTWSEASIEAVEDIVTRLIGILHEDILQGHLDEAESLILGSLLCHAEGGKGTSREEYKQRSLASQVELHSVWGVRRWCCEYSCWGSP